MTGKKEYGDYQTPEGFSTAVCKYLKDKKRINPTVIIEPTCGLGSFIKSSIIFEATEIIGIEINAEYCKECEQSIHDSRVRIINEDFFSFDLSDLTKEKDQLLVVGNPPWVNNTTLSKLNSENLPAKENFKGLKGIDALTGASNFDICEYMILQIIASLKNADATIAMLCKTSVARNVFAEMERTQTKFKSCEILEFDAKKVFGISAGACLLIIELSKSGVFSNECKVGSFDEPDNNKTIFRVVNGRLHKDAPDGTEDFSGECCFEWRQGIKHDCSKVMELSQKDGLLVNGQGEIADVEEKFVFPLVKSSMFKTPIINDFRKYVVVTQHKLGEDTAQLKRSAPQMWKYLTAHNEQFESRKSTIYKNAPPYSMFGIGEYSFAQYKVGVSGFYKKPLFSLLASDDGKPVMTDDTSYFICFPTYDTAYTAMLILNSEKVRQYLMSVAFLDAKRPFTKKILKQLDFRKILSEINLVELAETERNLGLQPCFNDTMLNEFKLLPELAQEEIAIIA